jgi:hypothetical protein
MMDHDTRQIIIALTAIVLAWSIAYLLTITFGQPFPSETVALADRQSSLATSGPCDKLGDDLR